MGCLLVLGIQVVDGLWSRSPMIKNNFTLSQTAFIYEVMSFIFRM
jgi:hypothetical protein